MDMPVQHEEGGTNTVISQQPEMISRATLRESTPGYAMIYQQQPEGDHDETPRSNDLSSVEGTGRYNSPAAASTTKHSNTAGTSTTSSSPWPAVIPNRRSSLEQQVTRVPSLTEMRFPQHVPNNQRPITHEITPRPSADSVPHYATSAFVTPPNSHSNNASAKDVRPGTAGSPNARRQQARLWSDSDDGPRRITPPDDLDRAKKSLDLLIDSDETLHYTLTPEPARGENKVSLHFEHVSM
jgi:hypothetical protein